MALAEYAARADSANAAAVANQGPPGWRRASSRPHGVVGSAEGTVDTFWAIVATRRTADAVRVRDYLLHADTVWDPDLRYWWRGSGDPGARWTLPRGCGPSPAIRWSTPPGDAWTRSGSCAGPWWRMRATSIGGCGVRRPGPGRHLVRGHGAVRGRGRGGRAELPRHAAVATASRRLDARLAREVWGEVAVEPRDRRVGWLSRWSGIAPTAWLFFALTGQPLPR